jgi:demethoxyubiquinone hydroxylase (CLK1/Coq7/Cat5 family)
MGEDGEGILEKLKPFYGFALGAAVALGGERLAHYLMDKYEEKTNKRIEELIDKAIKKYKEQENVG